MEFYHFVSGFTSGIKCILAEQVTEERDPPDSVDGRLNRKHKHQVRDHRKMNGDKSMGTVATNRLVGEGYVSLSLHETTYLLCYIMSKGMGWGKYIKRQTESTILLFPTGRLWMYVLHTTD